MQRRAVAYRQHGLAPVGLLHISGKIAHPRHQRGQALAARGGHKAGRVREEGGKIVAQGAGGLALPVTEGDFFNTLVGAHPVGGPAAHQNGGLYRAA